MNFDVLHCRLILPTHRSVPNNKQLKIPSHYCPVNCVPLKGLIVVWEENSRVYTNKIVVFRRSSMPPACRYFNVLWYCMSIHYHTIDKTTWSRCCCCRCYVLREVVGVMPGLIRFELRTSDVNNPCCKNVIFFTVYNLANKKPLTSEHINKSICWLLFLSTIDKDF